MDIVKNKDISVLNERRRGIRPAKSLFYFYVDNVDALNRATFSKEKLGAELNVSARTVANYILALANAGVIKYKYSGSMRLNPKNYFEGTQENYEKALLEYATYKSDV